MEHIATQLEVRDLQLVLALARAGSTARASQSLHLTQPAVSRALVATEEKLGVRLFERHSRGLSLTEAGERLVAGAPALLRAFAALERTVGAEPERRAQLRIVCECYTAYRWIPSALRLLERSLSNVELSLELRHTDDPARALQAGDVDVALLTTSHCTGADVDERPLFSDEVVFVLAASHPLAARSRLRVTDLRDVTLVTHDTPVAARQWFVQKVFGRSPPKLRVERLPLTEAVFDVARAGLAVAVVSEWVALPYLNESDLLMKRLPKKLERPWRLGFRKDSRSAALQLRTALQAMVPRLR